ASCAAPGAAKTARYACASANACRSCGSDSASFAASGLIPSSALETPAASSSESPDAALPLCAAGSPDVPHPWASALSMSAPSPLVVDVVGRDTAVTNPKISSSESCPCDFFCDAPGAPPPPFSEVEVDLDPAPRAGIFVVLTAIDVLLSVDSLACRSSSLSGNRSPAPSSQPVRVT